ncbi:MAG: hypothetical protein LBH46_01930 [Rickettsiales bacterium]|jgi:hypothetical protein|nr:hypothetical protein [Rickettsiales bacterium]
MKIISLVFLALFLNSCKDPIVDDEVKCRDRDGYYNKFDGSCHKYSCSKNGMSGSIYTDDYNDCAPTIDRDEVQKMIDNEIKKLMEEISSAT